MFDVRVAVGSSPEFFCGDFTDCRHFLKEATPLTDDEICGVLCGAWLREEEMTFEKDDCAVSVTPM